MKTETPDPVDVYRDGQKIKVELGSTGELLAWCYIGDDTSVEAIADLLSAKRLPRAAAKVRQMAMDARKAPITDKKNWLQRVTGL